MAVEEKKKAGQPTKYKPEFTEQVKKLCLLGAIDPQLADFFDVSLATISNWKNDFPEFLEAIKEGKQVADRNVEKSLYQRAMGYEHVDEKIFFDKDAINDGDRIIRAGTIKKYAPETAAAIFWLKNRKSKEWREKHEVELTNINPVKMDKEDQGTL